MSSGTRTPKARTSAAFSVAARRYEPRRVRSTASQTSRQATAEASTTHSRYLGMIMKPRSMAPRRNSGIAYGREAAPISTVSPPSSAMARPKVSSRPYR